MKLIIDSQPVDLATLPGASFAEYCRDVMQYLLHRNRAIATFALDGEPIRTVEQAEAGFSAASLVEISSIPLADALRASLDQQVDSLSSVVDACETLVTDSLLAEPADIAHQWQELCEAIKQGFSQIPSLAGLLTEEQIEDLIQERFTALGTVMRDIAQVLNKGDVVGFSDILELRLLPWLQHHRDFIAGLVERLASVDRQA